MLPSIDALHDDTYTHLLAPIWAYLARMDRPVRSDVIFVLGSLDLAVPRRAAKFYTAGLSPHVLVSGWFGSLTEHVLKKPEAVVFQEMLIRHGAPGRNITTELNASNTLEKVRFGIRALAARGQTPHSALLMAKTFVMRRCLATFAKQHPEVDVRGCPPADSVAVQRDRPRAAFAARLVGELPGSTRTGQTVTLSGRKSRGRSPKRRNGWRCCCRPPEPVLPC